MKINLDLEIPEETLQLFMKDGLKEDVAAPFMEELLTHTFNDFLKKFPEVYAGIRSGLIGMQELIEKGAIIGSNAMDDTKQKFKKE